MFETGLLLRTHGLEFVLYYGKVHQLRRKIRYIKNLLGCHPYMDIKARRVPLQMVFLQGNYLSSREVYGYDF